MRKIATALALSFALLVASASAQDISNPQTNASALTTGTVPAGRMPALTGDCTTSAGAVATTCTKTSGTAFGPLATQTAPCTVAQGCTGDTGTAWTAYTPTVTCATGTLTTATAAGRWKSLGKIVWLQVSVAITTVGTCTGNLNFSLPNAFTVNSTGSIYPGSAFDSSSTITLLVAYANASSATITFSSAPTTHTYYARVTFEAT
jgi:hypothetical protein